MDINQLKCFISVAQTLNFSEAARRNYVSQSTVSRYVSDLEKEFGVRLFVRSHRDVVITNEGKILLPYAVDIVNSLKKAQTVIKQLRDGATGKITLGCDVTSLSFPSRCIAAFGKSYGGISVDLRQLDHTDRSGAITGGDYDFCFMPRDMVPESSDIETVQTHTDPLVVVSTPRKRLRKSGVSLADIADERLLLLSEACAPILYMEVMDMLRTFHIAPKTDSGFDELNSLCIAVASGMGVSILPQSLARFLSNDKIAACPINDLDTSVAYVMAWSKRLSNPVAGLFLNTVRKFADEDDGGYGL